MPDPFDTTRDGRAVGSIRLTDGTMSARILTLGAILQDLRAGDRPLTLGADDLAAYDGGPLKYFGAVIGPVAGRITGARGPLGDATLRLEANEGPNTLHSGSAGLHANVWEVVDEAPSRVTMATTAAPGAGGLPGTRRFTVTYALEGGALDITLTAETDAPTWVNLTHHGYWHLGPEPGIDGHRLWLAADDVLDFNAEKLPTGRVLPVAGGPFDFRTERKLTPSDRVDHCFAMADAERAMTEIATLRATDGACLHLSGTAPALVVFTGDGVRCGPATDRPGLALEPQGWSDAPNHAEFPSIVLEPGKVWRRHMRFAFAPPG